MRKSSSVQAVSKLPESERAAAALDAWFAEVAPAISDCLAFIRRAIRRGPKRGGLDPAVPEDVQIVSSILRVFVEAAQTQVQLQQSLAADASKAVARCDYDAGWDDSEGLGTAHIAPEKLH